MSGARLYLVAYDIASPRRWRHVVGILKRLGERRQLSVFVCRMEPRRRERLERKLRAILDAKADRLMIVDLGPAETAARRLAGGLPPPDGALLL